MFPDVTYIYDDDAPKLNPDKDDRLQVATYAERIARTIAAMEAPNGYTIGLHGAWGSGKSTILNFVTAYVERINDSSTVPPILHIPFRPWLISGHNNLVAVFFKILFEHLSPKSTRRLAFWQARSSLINDTSASLIDALATVATVLDPSVGIASRIGGNVTKKFVPYVVNYFKTEPSLQAAYIELSHQLRESKLRFLVTIDDIDRLEPADIRCIMRMVKSVGQLPNVVYLLAYDRKIVWDALDRDIDRMGPAFAEKIIQQELEMPSPNSNSLLRMLDGDIAFVLAETSNSHRWQVLLRDGVHRWIRTPRDVVRLSNALKFAWPTLRSEFDPQDLIGMEGLRLFDSDAYEWLRNSRDFLFSEGRFVLAQDELKKEALEALKRSIPGGERHQVLEVISMMFPQVGALDDDIFDFAHDTHEEIVRRRGIGCQVGYDTYFSLRPSEDAIPVSVLEHVMLSKTKKEDIVAVFRKYIEMKDTRGTSLVSELLEELRIRYLPNDAPKPNDNLLQALFDVGEDVIAIEGRSRSTELPASSLMDFVIYNLLTRWGVEEAGEQLLKAFEDCRSVCFLSSVFVSRGMELKVFGSSGAESPCITREVFEKLGEILLKKTKTAYGDDTLSDAPFVYGIARAWAYLECADVVREWLIREANRSAVFMGKLSIGLVAYSVEFDGKDYKMMELPREDYLDLEGILSAARRHSNSLELGEDERRRIVAVVGGLAGRIPESKSVYPG